MGWWWIETSELQLLGVINDIRGVETRGEAHRSRSFVTVLHDVKAFHVRIYALGFERSERLTVSGAGEGGGEGEHSC